MEFVTQYVTHDPGAAEGAASPRLAPPWLSEQPAPSKSASDARISLCLSRYTTLVVEIAHEALELNAMWVAPETPEINGTLELLRRARTRASWRPPRRALKQSIVRSTSRTRSGQLLAKIFVQPICGWLDE